jgi:hypothetical protein
MSASLHGFAPTRMEMSFRPNPQLVPIVRRFVADVYRRVIASDDDVDRIAMAAHELVENAVRFSNDGAAVLRIDVTPGDPARVTICTTNSASAENLATVVGWLQEMMSVSDPFTFYLEAMRETARRAHGSGLGLARVFAEGALDLDCKVEGDTIIVTAKGTLHGGEQ